MAGKTKLMNRVYINAILWVMFEKEKKRKWIMMAMGSTCYIMEYNCDKIRDDCETLNNGILCISIVNLKL